MAIKEIFASVEINDHEVRIVVGEFFETRYNILRVERAGISGVKRKRIIDEQNVANGIIKALKQVEDNLGYHIERVLLIVPSVNVKRVCSSVNVEVEAVSKRIRLGDIQRGRNEAIKHREDSDLVLVNVGTTKYITNGITSRKMPLNELCDEFTMDVDLLFADREVVYSYARCIEKAGLEILDICLDSYAIAQEAAIFEQTLDKYVILVNIERETMTLSLFTHGRLMSSRLIEKGYSVFFDRLKRECGFTNNVAYRLAQNTCRFVESEARDTTIYIYSEQGQQRLLTEKEVAAYIETPIRNWIKEINGICQEIVESGNVKYILVGEGMELLSMPQLLDDLNAPWQIYVPQIIGARDSALTSSLGAFYSWKEQLEIKNDNRCSCAQQEVEKVMDALRLKANENVEGGFTKKLKKILLSDK